MKVGEYVAFGNGRDREVSLLCEITHIEPMGAFTFMVLNGGWTGLYAPITSRICVARTGEWLPANILWRGPEPSGRGYNEQMASVQAQVDAPIKMRLEALWAGVKSWREYRLVVRFERRQEPRENHEDADDSIPF